MDGKSGKTTVRHRNIRDLAYVFLSCLFLAVGVNIVYEPMEMVIGGITGLAITVKSVVHDIWGIEVSVSFLNLLFNIPILIWAIKSKGWRFFFISLYGTATLSIMLAVIPIVSVSDEDMLLATLIGGVLTGIGMGIIFRAGLSTGGTDLIATLLSVKSKRFTESVILGIVDGIIVLSGMSVFGVNKSMYALITLFIMSRVADAVVSGFSYTKLMMIVCDNAKDVSEGILNGVNRGVTLWDAKGAYSLTSKSVLMCACSHREVGKVTRIAADCDKKSFVVILSAKEILGEGFKTNL